MRTNRMHILLSTGRLSDAERASLISGIEKVAPASALMKVAAIAASYGALQQKGTTLAAAIAAVVADEAQHELDVKARDAARVSVDTELSTLRTLVANNATTYTDVAGMGFTVAVPSATSRTVPSAAPVVTTKVSRQRGRIRVVVVETGATPGTYAAEVSPDPIGASTWSSMPGTGKQRTVTGATGSVVWVRFAQVRYGVQGEWSTPLRVTLP